jgi:L-lactate utilization protein LutB
MYDKPVSMEEVNAAAAALKSNGINSYIATSIDDAKKKVFELIPPGAQIMTMTSVTLDTLGLAKELNESGNYNPVRTKLMDPAVSGREKKMLGAAPEYVIGSVHAVSQEGKVYIASNTGSQLAAYVYGADHVVWVVGTQKIVKDDADARKRIYEYVLPQESVRANKAYNITTGSFVSKLLTVNREITPNRITIVFVPEVLGF